MSPSDVESRQRLIMDTFVELADTLASDYDVSDFLDLLVDRCGRVLQADTAGVLLEGDDGRLRLAAALSDEMRRIEQIEIDQGEGPCVQAYRNREQVIAPDLERCSDVWPSVVPKLREMGMRAGFSFPLRLREDCIGALNIYRRHVGALEDDEMRLGQALADVAAIGILQQRRVVRAEERSAQLQHALDSRVVIEQAKGVLAQRAGVSPGEAFEALRRHARGRGQTVRGLAQQVVDGVDAGVTLAE